jgi:hypothetical protein
MKLTEVKFDPHAYHDVTKSESSEVPHLPDAAKIAEYLKKYSPTMVAFAQRNRFFYRGMAKKAFSELPGVIHTSVRKNRLPVEMEQEYHEALIDVFDAEGLKVNRANSIFVTTSERIASSWGNVYAVFPKEPWTGLYFFDKVEDYSFFAMRMIAKFWINDRKKLAIERLRSLGPTELDASDKATINKLFNNQQVEVLINCKDYIAIDIHSQLFDDIREELDL